VPRIRRRDICTLPRENLHSPNRSREMIDDCGHPSPPPCAPNLRLNQFIGRFPLSHRPLQKTIQFLHFLFQILSGSNRSACFVHPTPDIPALQLCRMQAARIRYPLPPDWFRVHPPVLATFGPAVQNKWKHPAGLLRGWVGNRWKSPRPAFIFGDSIGAILSGNVGSAAGASRSIRGISGARYRFTSRVRLPRHDRRSGRTHSRLPVPEVRPAILARQDRIGPEGLIGAVPAVLIGGLLRQFVPISAALSFRIPSLLKFFPLP
jgi:hypothetical protein